MNKALLESRLKPLYSRHSYGIKFGLEPMLAVMSAMGNPHLDLNFIHVAGTNGKGSVCAMMESVLRHSGLKTGFYSSPHLSEFNERITAGGRKIDDSRLVALIDMVAAHSSDYAKHPGGRELTFFEFVTAMAFAHFKAENTDVVILETGMGGRLDATNVVNPIVSIITCVTMEHAEYLGNTIPQIAREKAGIIKQNRPVVTGNMDNDATAVVREVAASLNAPVIRADDTVSITLKKRDIHGQRMTIETGSASYGSILLPLHGKHQTDNCAIAVAGLEVFASAQNIELEAEAVKAGLQNTVWPARFQVLSRNPPVILDGAHNPAAAMALTRTLRDLFKNQPVGLIMGMCSDKDIDGFLSHFKGLASICWAVKINNPRGRSASDIAQKASVVCRQVHESTLEKALIDSKEWAKTENGVVCICGSLFLCGEVLALQTAG